MSISYRLRQTDFDGGEGFSKVVSVKVGTDWQSVLRVFPNPPLADGELTLFLPENMEEEMTVQLFNPAGQLVRSATVGGGANSLDVSGLTAGVYSLQVWNGKEHFFEVIAVQN